MKNMNQRPDLLEAAALLGTLASAQGAKLPEVTNTSKTPMTFFYCKCVG